MGGPADVPWSGLAQRAGSPHTLPERVGAAWLSIDDLTWSEIADAVWLAAVGESFRPGYTPKNRVPLSGDQSPTHTDLAASDIPSERDPEVPLEPNERPAEQPAEPELPTHPWARGHLTGRESARVPTAGMSSRLPPTDLDRVRPAASALLAADAVRALRPFKRKVLSWHEDDVVLDAEATAERAAQDGLWWPVTKPGLVRWLDLTLVVDAGPSMALWQSTVTGFVSLVQQLGAFRSIQLRLLETHRSTADSSAVPVLRGGTTGTPSRSPAELVDPLGRRMVLVVTDGVGESWRQGSVLPMLAEWGAAMPVAVVHLLPQRLWARGGLAPHRARLSVPGPLQPNRRWGLALSDAWLDPQLAAAVPAGVVPVPVLELDARWLGWWATLVTGQHGGPADAMVLLASHQPQQRPVVDIGGVAAGEPPARERVQRFLSVASPAAFRLATLLAAVPVSVPVARLVQAELVPESGPDHLAEVFSSGLLRPSEGAANHSWDAITFDFPEAVRAELLSAARRSETARVVRVTAERFGGQISGLDRLQNALDDPDNTPVPAFTSDTANEVAIERIVMRALTGPYLSRATRLSRLGQHEPGAASVNPTTASHRTTTVSETMPDAAGRTDIASVPAGTLAAPSSSSEGSASVPVVPAHEARSGDPAAVVQRAVSTQFSSPELRARKPGDVPPVWGNVPPRNPNFTGRVELLDQLGEGLVAGGATAVLPAALHGMGGIGKTQMAVEYIYRRLDNYDLVWWIQATQVARIRAGLTELARHLGLPGSGEANTAVPAVREALRTGHPFGRWLLVFDAAESPENVRPFFPTNGPGEILITSRNSAWAGIARPLEVTVFERTESIELLQRRGPEINQEEADHLAEKLGDLPLALEQAAAWRAETGMPVHEYLRLFDEKVTEILDTSAPADYEVSVAAAWNVSFDELATRNPAAHQFLQVCAFFAPEPISRSLFTGVRGVSISPELDKALRDPMQLGRAIRDINRYSLAKIDHRNDTLLLHRLVQLILRNRMAPQVRAEMRHGAHQLLANLDPRDPATARQWPLYLDVLPHVYASALVECDDGWGRQLILNLMQFLYHWGDHEGALNLARRAFDAWTARLSGTDTQTLQAAERLGFYLWELGRYTEAAELNQHTLELRRQVSGDDSEETMIVQLAVTSDLKAKGDFAGAKKLSEEVLVRARGLFGDDDPTTLNAAHTHAISLRFTGEYRAALKLDEDTYRRRVEVLGYDHANTISSLSAVILDLRESGDYAAARVENEKLADRVRNLFGEDRAITLRRLSYLAVARRKDGDHDSALELSTDVLERLRARYGDDHPTVLGCALSHSMDVRHSGDLQTANRLGEQEFERFRRNQGERHPHTLAAMVDLAVTLRLLGDVDGARQLDERAFEQFRGALGPDHPYAIISAINLASDLAAQGQTEAALALDNEALDRAHRVLGADHPTTLGVSLNLVLDLRALGRKQEAETKYADVLTGYRQVLGETHPATMAAARGIRADCDIDPLPF